MRNSHRRHTVTEHIKRDVELAQLAFDTVMRVREEGRKKHPDDDGDNKDVSYHLLRAHTHNSSARWYDDSFTSKRMHMKHELTRVAMALLKDDE